MSENSELETDEVSEYQRMIERKRLEKKEFLKNLGFDCNDDVSCSPFKHLHLNTSDQLKSSKKTTKKSSSWQKNGHKNSKENNVTTVRYHSPVGVVTRRSSRLSGKAVSSDLSDSAVIESEELISYEKAKAPTPVRRENVFGAIPGIEVGTVFESRIAASHAGIHRPTVAGIHGDEKKGCYSLALSGGYEGDIDNGDEFTYTGEGGRDLKGTKANPKNLRTAPQSKDQTLTKGNLALTKNIEHNLPVRVIRGYKLKSFYAPEEGYRYDGLYNVVKYWEDRGVAGFRIYKYYLKRIPDQEPLLVTQVEDNSEEEEESKTKNTEEQDTDISVVIPNDDFKKS